MITPVRHLMSLFVVATLLTALSVARSQGDRPAGPEARSVAAGAQEHRVALVIGNAAYRDSPLKNPVNDARAMRDRLQQIGFDVVFKEDLRTREVGSILREFRNRLRPGSVALFFYAGHGLQIRGENFLPTVDAEIASEEDVSLQSLSVNTLLSLMDESKAGVNLVLLDACRNNPYARSFRSSSVGLARIEAPSGTLIHYATRPGSVAEDGKGTHGTYTAALLAQMAKEAVPVEQTLKQVTVQVKNATKGKQVPWMEGSLTGEFYFILKGPTQVTIHQIPPDADGAAWQAAEAGGTAAAYQAYLNEFPSGLYASAARVKLANLAAGKAAAEKAPADERSDPDMALWKEVRGSGNREHYETYLKEFPRGKYAALARMELKTLAAKEREERAESDRQAWETAKQINTQDSYDAYLTAHPKGSFAAQAQRARDKARAAARTQIAQSTAAEEKNRTAKDKKAAQTTEPPPKTKQEEIREAALRELSMARLSAAEFAMGAASDDTSDSPETDEQARPQHQVRIGEFELGYYEVTVGQFRKFVEATGYRTEAERPGSNAGCYAPQRDGTTALQESASWRQPGFAQDDSHPVVCVSWNDVQRYIAWLNGPSPSWRLPSETEWEYAARAGTVTGRPWSDAGGFFSRLLNYAQKPEDTPARPTHQACKYANIADKRIASQLQWTALHDCDDGYAFTVPGGYFKRNNFSLNDMIGNVAEWTQDCWSPNYRGAPADGKPWMSGDCGQHVFRGGSWSSGPIHARSAARNKNLASYRATDLGFRLARTKQP